MAQTQQGAFDFTYMHIDAPTHQDDEWGKEHKSRRLVVPSNFDATMLDTWREAMFYYLRDNVWTFKRKLDGENLRIQWDGEQAVWNGKSNNFVCSHALTGYMNKTFLEEIFEERFERSQKVILCGEHMGPKVQGNELGLTETQFVLFDVNIDGYWLTEANIKSIAKYFGIKTCYDFMDKYAETHEDRLMALINRVAEGEFKNWEGIVAVPAIECRTRRGERVICKIKNKDYLPKEKK